MEKPVLFPVKFVQHLDITGVPVGVSQWIVGNQITSENLSFSYSDPDKIRYPWYNRSNLDYTATKIIISWLFRNGFSESHDSKKHPILLAIPYFMSDLNRQRITSLLFHNIEVTKWNQPNPINSPFVCLKERELLALDACNLDTGIVIFLDKKINSMVSIKMNKIIDSYCYNKFHDNKIIVYLNNLINMQFMSGVICYKNIIIVSNESSGYNDNLVREINKFTLTIDQDSDEMDIDEPVKLKINIGSLTKIHLLDHKSILYYSHNKDIRILREEFIKNPF